MMLMGREAFDILTLQSRKAGLQGRESNLLSFDEFSLTLSSLHLRLPSENMLKFALPSICQVKKTRPAIGPNKPLNI